MKNVEEIQQDVANVGSDVRKVVSDLSSSAKDALSRARETAEEYYDEGVQKTRELGKSLERQVRDDPLKTLLVATGIAAAAGLTLGLLLRK